LKKRRKRERRRVLAEHFEGKGIKESEKGG
jgi:hypothetical protein